MNNSIDFLGIKVNNFTMSETIDKISNAIELNQKILREDINAAKIVWLQKSNTLKEVIQNANIINADGQSIVFASKLLKQPIKQRVTGIDLMNNLIDISYKKGWKIFFLGAKIDVVKDVVNRYSKEYSKDIIAGFKDGYFNINQEDSIIKLINNSKANILFIGISTPKKEQFINRNFDRLNVNLVMGVGGSFDVIAKRVKRAPKFMQKYALEWLYRLYQEPRKMWRRYLYTNTLFILLVLKRVIKNSLQ